MGLNEEKPRLDKETTRSMQDASRYSSIQHTAATCYVYKTTHERLGVSIRFHGGRFQVPGNPLEGLRRWLLGSDNVPCKDNM